MSPLYEPLYLSMLARIGPRVRSGKVGLDSGRGKCTAFKETCETIT